MAKSNTLPKILCIGDPHARPDVSNRRFEALGNFIVDKRPDIVVCIGDFADMGSLSSYDKGTGKAEGQRYSDDLEAVYDAQRKIFSPVRAQQFKLFGQKKKKWEPEFHMVMGNHEERISRYANQSPELIGHVGFHDLKYEEFGWKVTPFLTPLKLHNICFQHYFTSGLMGRPISGDYAAAHLVKKNYMSCVAGHSHLRNYWETTDITGRKRFGLVLGCYDEGEHSYAKGSAHAWWSGLTMLHEVDDGSAEPAFFSLDYLLEKYT